MTSIKKELAARKGTQKLSYLAEVANDLDWKNADILMRELRNRLGKDAAWRLGGSRIRNIFKKYAAHAQSHLGRQPKRYLDFGAGLFQPLGFSTLFWLHGAERCIALDPDPAMMSGMRDFIASRTAQSLWDIICEAIAEPHEYGFTGHEWISHLDKLDRTALRRGDLEQGLGSAPILRFCGFIQDMPSDEMDFDFVTSQAVLEHVQQFERVAGELYHRTAPGGIHFHDVDFRDHRSFKRGDEFGRLDFLFTDEGDGGHCNRLRVSEVCAIFERAGFTILKCEKRQAPNEDSLRAKLARQFQHLSDDDLATTGAAIFLRRDAS